MGGRPWHGAVAPSGGRAHGLGRGRLGDPRHAHRLRQVHGGPGALLHGRGHGAHRLLHGAHQGARVREVLRHGGHPRPRERGHDHRRLHHQHRGAGHLLHGGDPREPGPARGPRVEGGLRGDGRVPLLRRPRSRLGLAGAAAHAAERAVPADERHPRRRERHRRRPGGAHRPARRPGDRRAPPRAAVLRLHLRNPGSHRGAGSARRRGTDVHRAFLPGRGAEERPGAGQLRRVGQGPARGNQAGHEGHEVHHPLRQDFAAAARRRGGRAPCGHAAALPPARGAPRPAGAAPSHLRYRHARRGHQCAHPHGGAHPAHQVRRHQDAPFALPRVPPDCGPRGTGRLRHRGHGGGACPRA